MLRQDLSNRCRELRAARVPFVYARVVLAEQPTSAKPGDEAIIMPDGTMEGFVGGACAESTVREQSLSLLETGETMMLRITPDPEPDQAGRHVVHNPCLSGGTLELFLEAFEPPPLVLVVGDAPIARALLHMGAQLGYDLRPFDRPVPSDAAAVIVAAHGRGEEPALSAALDAGVPYIGLVASPRRGAAVVAGLEVADELKARIHTPAGLDIGARTAPEVALSILAGIVASHPRPPSSTGGHGPPHPGAEDGIEGSGRPTLGTDPVCGMTVTTGAEGWQVQHDGRDFWFCGRGCRDAFLANPGAYGS
jgi:xanthine dehydrogenase accessory factor